MKSLIKKRMKSSITASLLVVSTLAAAWLTGCSGAKNEKVTDNTGVSSSISGSENSGGSPAKGRYMEGEIALPEEVAQMKLLSCLLKEDKSLEFYFKGENDEILSYSYGKEGWVSQELPFQPLDEEKKKNISSVVKGKDGNCYLGGYGQGNKYHLYMVDGSGTLTEVFEDAFSVPEGRQYGPMPDFYAILPDGSLLMSTMSDAAVFSKDGKKLFSIPQDMIGTDVRNSVYATDSSYLTLLNGQIVCYDIGTGEPSASYPMPSQVSSGTGRLVLYEDEDKSIYAAGQTGLYHIGKGGTIWEQIIDGSLNSMGRQDIYLKHFYPGADQDYFGIFQKSEVGETILIRYTYDENVDTVPPTTLTVYSLRDSATVRQAASMMQKDNPDVRVDLRISVEDESEEVTEDVIRALNTELLNGKGADVLILDGLPAKSYENKGILLDLKEVIGGVEPKLLPGLTKGFTREDGKIYYLPARIKLPVVYGEPEAVKALTSLNAMEAYEGGTPLLAQDTYGNVIRLTARTCYQELFDESGALRDGMLGKWLSAVKSAGEKAGIKSEYTLEEFEKLGVNNDVMADGFGRQDAYSFAGKKCAAAAELLSSINNSMLTVAAADTGAWQLENKNHTFVPATLVGINASTEQRETAEEFVRTLFGPQVQNEMLWDGFAVRNDSLEQWMEEEKESVESVGMYGSDFVLQAQWPSTERREEIYSLLREANLPLVVDESIIDMVIAGSKDYFDKKEPLERAVQTIENKIRLYMAEKE